MSRLAASIVLASLRLMPSKVELPGRSPTQILYPGGVASQIQVGRSLSDRKLPLLRERQAADPDGASRDAPPSHSHPELEDGPICPPGWPAGSGVAVYGGCHGHCGGH
eukprot:3174754-Lingulodinium_polyedra.AAC.1